MNTPIYDKSTFELLPTPIEILGHSKNQILDAKEMLSELPTEYNLKLSLAFQLLDEVQEYLFNN